MAGGHGGGASFGGSVLPRVAGVNSDVNADINVTPMIDVMLVLLIIFMVVTPALAYEAKLPKAKTSAPEKDERVTLGVDKNGQYWIEDVPNPGPIPLNQLQGRLQQAYDQRARILGQSPHLADRRAHRVRPEPSGDGQAEERDHPDGAA